MPRICRQHHHHHHWQQKNAVLPCKLMIDDGSNFVKKSKWQNSVNSGPIHTKPGPISIIHHSRRSHYHHRLRRRRRGRRRRRRCRIRVYSSSCTNVLMANSAYRYGTILYAILDASLSASNTVCMPSS